MRSKNLSRLTYALAFSALLSVNTLSAAAADDEAMTTTTVEITTTTIVEIATTTADEDSIESTTESTTVTTTVPQENDNGFVYDPPESFSVTLDFFDKDTLEKVNGVSGRIEKWTFEDCHFSAFGTDHEVEIIHEFEITEKEPLRLPEVETDRNYNSSYVLIVDNLPGDYVFAKAHPRHFQKNFEIDSPDIFISVPLYDSPVPEFYPISGTYSSDIQIIDQYFYETVEGLECVLFNVDTGEELESWNTSEYPTKTVELQYYFENHIDSDKYRYAIRILNFPEDMHFYYFTPDGLAENEMYVNTICQEDAIEEENKVVSNRIPVVVPGKERPADMTYIVNPITGTGTHFTTTATEISTTMSDSSASTTQTTVVSDDETEPPVTDKTVPTTQTTIIPDTETTTASSDEELPQTGYSRIYRMIAALASAMTFAGGAILIKNRKEDAE